MKIFLVAAKEGIGFAGYGLVLCCAFLFRLAAIVLTHIETA